MKFRGVLALVLTCALVQAKADISGVVFEDTNFNGILDGGESGYANVGVSLTDASGVQRNATSVQGGNFSIATSGLTAPVRIEVASPGIVGVSAGVAGDTTVLFLNALDYENVQVAFSKSNVSCQENPELLVPRITTGPRDGAWTQDPAVVSFPFNSSGAPAYELYNAFPTADYTGPAQKVVAHSDIGTVFGAAYERSNRRAFFSAFVRRGAGLGPGGTGAIYAVKEGGVQLHADINAIFGANTAGADPHEFSADPLDFFEYDKGTVPYVYKRGFGDLDISEDGGTLFAVNLADRKLYLIPTHGAISLATVSRYDIPRPLDCDSDFRPFALGVHNGAVFVGGVCAHPSSTDKSIDAVYTQEDLQAYVYRFENGTFQSAPVLQFSLLKSYFDARSWIDTIPTTIDELVALVGKPALTDIEFEGNDMILLTRDRGGDQYMSATHLITRAGELFRACYNGGTGSWDIEQDGTCGGVNGAGKALVHKFYAIQPGLDTRDAGAALALPGKDLAVIANDPYWPWSGGMHWYSGAGTVSRRYEVFHTYTGVVQGKGLEGTRFNGTFQKLNGLGDLEAICDAPPIEIGNRVWADDNRNGIQDPSEAGIEGVELQLFDKVGAVQIGTVTTNSQGLYYFGGLMNAHLNSGVTLLAFHDYEIRMPLNQPALAGRLATVAFATTTTLDSNAVNNVPAGYATVAVSTTGIGVSDHTFDIGVVPPVLIGDYVWFDANSDGVQAPAESPRVGVTVSLLDPLTSSVIAMTTTNSNGLYYFTPSEGVLPNKKYLIILNNPLDFNGTGPLAGLSLTAQNAGGDDLKDSDAALRNGMPTIEAQAPNMGADLSFDFGFVITPKQTPTPTPTPTPPVIDVTPLQFQLDSNANVLLNQALRAVSERKRGAAKGVCSPAPVKLLEKFRTQAQQHFNTAWEITWSKLPSSVYPIEQVAANSACSQAQVASAIQSFVNEVTGLGEVGVSALKPCRTRKGSKASQKAFSRVKKARAALETAQTQVGASAAAYPQNVAVCR